jgi:two-component system chemotaxis sensor kinase CheA
MDNRSSEDQETIREFLIESHENLTRLDQDLVELEKHPQNPDLLRNVFRTFHTIKGACGFLAFTNLEKLTHQAENLLSQLRDGKRELNPDLVSLILETVDATRKVLGAIEANGEEGALAFGELTERLRATAQMGEASVTKPVPVQAAACEPAPAAQTAAIEQKQSEPQPQPQIEVPWKELDPRAAEDRRKGQRRQATNGDNEEIARPSAVDANIRVGVGLLDKLMDLVGELVLTRNQILQFNAEREDAVLNATSQRLNLITSELQEGVMKTRMQPIGVVWQNLPRVVRDVAVSLGKQIEIKMDGADTELDRTIIEAIKDPLIHLVRNSCDHGIELPVVRMAAGKPAQGTMFLRAYHEGGQVNIEVGDDGAGVDLGRVRQKAVEQGIVRPEHAEKLSDREALNLIFLPGFSTVKTVTNISGRGVGMDVVKSHIEKIGGAIDISSRQGEGTTVKIRIPLTLAIIPGLVVTSGGERFVIPQVSLLELIRLETDASGKHIEYVHGSPVYRRRGSLLPIAFLNQILGLRTTIENEALSMVVLQAEDRQFGLVVDGINDTQEIVVKPLGKQLKGLTLYAGATIMGDGHVSLILDVLGIAQRSGVFGELREQIRTAEKAKNQVELEQQRLLLCRAGSFQRLAVPLSLVARLEELPQSSVELAGGGRVVQYRDSILPLVSLCALLEPGVPDTNCSADPMQVVVFNDGDRSVGMVVDEIIDIVEDAVTARQKSARRGLLGSGVIGKRVTDFLDLSEVIGAAKSSWLKSPNRISDSKVILVADSSSFFRNLIRSGLAMEGYSVVEASNLEEALHQVERSSPALVITALDLPPKGASLLASALRSRSEWKSIPILALTDSEVQLTSCDLKAGQFQGCCAKLDMSSVCSAVSALVTSSQSKARELACAGEGAN